jgi:hypothetical protein
MMSEERKKAIARWEGAFEQALAKKMRALAEIAEGLAFDNDSFT